MNPIKIFEPHLHNMKHVLQLRCHACVYAAMQASASSRNTLQASTGTPTGGTGPAASTGTPTGDGASTAAAAGGAAAAAGGSAAAAAGELQHCPVNCFVKLTLHHSVHTLPQSASEYLWLSAPTMPGCRPLLK